MSESVPLPNHQNLLLSVRRLREELEAVRKQAVARDEMVRSGLAKVGLDGKLIVSNALLEPMAAQILGIEGRIEGAAAAVERLETWAFDKEGGYEVGARKLTQLDAELRMIRGEGDEMRSVFTAAAQARDLLESRVQATEGQILVEAQKRTELFSKLNIMDGAATELGEGIRANATATSDLTTRVTATEGLINAVAQDVTTLRTDITVIEGNVGGITGTVAANSQAIGSLESRTTASEGLISTQAGQITTLTSELSTAKQGISANANATDALTTRVAASEGQISAVATRTSTLETKVPADSGRAASEASVNSLQTATSAADAALGQRIDTVTATANGAQSTAASALAASATNASAITQVRAGQAGGGNMLANADFGVGSSGLILALSQWGNLASGVNWGGSERVPQGGTQFGFTAGGSPQGVVVFDHTSEAPATEGENWIASARLGTLDARAKVQLLALDANGSVIDYAESGWVEAFPGVAIGSWPLVSARFTNGTPPGTTRVRWRWETDRLRGANPYSWVTQIGLAKGALGQIQPGPWAAGATGLGAVTQELRAGLNSTTGRLNATYGLAVAVNGRAVGMRIANDGAVGRIEFEGDSVAFLPPNGAANGIEFTPGNTVIRQFGTGWQRIQSAIPFGPDGLVMYFGPNVGVAAASKALATKWEDANGNAYTGGTFSAGALKNAAQSSVVSAAASVETGNFATNGNTRVVTSSMSYENAGRDANNLPTVAIWADIAIERSRDNGASWQQVTTFRASGTRTNEGLEPGLGYSMRYSIGGSVTHNDNTGGTQPCNYRARIFAASGSWPYTLVVAGQSRPGNQRLTIQSMES